MVALSYIYLYIDNKNHHTIVVFGAMFSNYCKITHKMEETLSLSANMSLLNCGFKNLIHKKNI